MINEKSEGQNNDCSCKVYMFNILSKLIFKKAFQKEQFYS